MALLDFGPVDSEQNDLSAGQHLDEIGGWFQPPGLDLGPYFVHARRAPAHGAHRDASGAAGVLGAAGAFGAVAAALAAAGVPAVVVGVLGAVGVPGVVVGALAAADAPPLFGDERIGAAHARLRRALHFEMSVLAADYLVRLLRSQERQTKGRHQVPILSS